jgi:serine/threonine-protein kinase
MGEVYRATDTRLDRTVAVKILSDGIVGDPDLRARFEREARAVALLDHPHICAVYDVGQQDDVSYLVMQYLEGETLTSLSIDLIRAAQSIRCTACPRRALEVPRSC